MQGFEGRCDVLVFAQSHQDPGSADVYLLEFLNTLARDPDEKCDAVAQSEGDKGVEEPFCIRKGGVLMFLRWKNDLFDVVIKY